MSKNINLKNDLQKAILFAYWIGACAGDIIIATLAEDVLTGGAFVAMMLLVLV